MNRHIDREDCYTEMATGELVCEFERLVIEWQGNACQSLCVRTVLSRIWSELNDHRGVRLPCAEALGDVKHLGRW